MSTEKLRALFSHKVLSALKERGLITDTVMAQILSQPHTGFSAWWGEQILPGDESYRLFLAGYIDKGPVANSRIEIRDDVVTYHTDKDQKTHEFDALEFLARLTPHVKKKWESTVRYFGHYSHRARGARKKKETFTQPLTILPLPAEQKRKASQAWAALIKRVFELDPLLCPRCGSAMTIRAFITDTNQVRRLLKSLNIPEILKPQPINAAAPPAGLVPFLDDFQFVV